LINSRSYFIIFNPMASRGGAARSRDVIEKAFRASAVAFELVETQYRGHAVELAERAVDEGWSAAVAVGGDGVVHEVANGLMNRAGDDVSLPLGVIPVGSGNDFIKMLRMPVHKPAAAVRRIVEASVRTVDIGRVTHHTTGGGPSGVWHFTNGVGVGFDAQVATHARGIQRLRGMSIYAWALVKTLRDLRSPRIRVVVDGKQIADQPLILTTISNGPCHGGSFWLCPGASIDDGALDILIADARPLPAVLRLLPRVLFGKHLGQKGVSLHRGTHVEIHSDSRLPIHADGEIVADWVSDLTVEVLPGKLAVLG
jgi:diacylglycerol kinase (ATP)